MAQCAGTSSLYAEEMFRTPWAPTGIGIASGLLLLGLTESVDVISAAPLAIGGGTLVAVVVGWPASRRWLPWASCCVAGASLAATAAALATNLPSIATGDAPRYMGSPAAGMLGLLEAVSLLVLLALLLRTASTRVMVAVGSLLVVADLAWLLRIPPAPSVAAGLVTLLVWFLGPLVAAIAGGYPRLAEARRRRSVAEAQRAQRLRLTRDLHDFVAHDVTGTVVQAQAAQHVGQHDPAIALEALRRIEIAGQQALASIDHALDLLRDPDPLLERSVAGPTREVTDMVAAREVTDMVAGFGVAGGPAIEADIDDTAWRVLGPDRVNLARRVLAEALTNVRRHAPVTSQVQVRLTADDHRVELTVTNPLPDGPPSARSSKRGGQGLAQSATLVADSGGELSAGSCGDRWLLRLRLPALRPAER